MKARRAWTLMLALACLMPLAACNAENNPKVIFMKKQVVADVVLFSYLDRPIFDVYLNGQYAGGVARFPYGVRGTVVGVTIPFGPQTLTWRDAGSGSTSAIKTPLTLTSDQVPLGSHYLGLHIYPDDTAELIFSEDFPELSPRGREMKESWEKMNGQ